MGQELICAGTQVITTWVATISQKGRLQLLAIGATQSLDSETPHANF